MKTIEEFEIEITSKIAVAQDQMSIFKENIPKIGSVIGRDTTEVYNVLLSALTGAVERYNSLGARNAETLQPIVDKLEKIINVLAEVMASIEKIDQAQGENQSSLEVRNDVTNTMTKASEDVDALIDVIPSVPVPSNPIVANPGLALASGIAAFFIANKIAKLGPFASFALAAGAAYYMGNVGKE